MPIRIRLGIFRPISHRAREKQKNVTLHEIGNNGTQHITFGLFQQHSDGSDIAFPKSSLQRNLQHKFHFDLEEVGFSIELDNSSRALAVLKQTPLVKVH